MGEWGAVGEGGKGGRGAEGGAAGSALSLSLPAAGGALPFPPTYSVPASSQLQYLSLSSSSSVSAPSFYLVVSLSVLVFWFCVFFSFFYFTLISFPSWFLSFPPSSSLSSSPLPLPSSPSLRFFLYLKVSLLCPHLQLDRRKEKSSKNPSQKRRSG